MHSISKALSVYYKGLSILFLAVFFGCNDGRVEPSTPLSMSNRPNVIYILADDLGYGELGVYGQDKIETPNLDALANSGMRFTQHYSGAPVCAPARYMLLTGKHAGHSFIRGNDEWDERGEVWNYRAVILDSTLEGQRPIPITTVLLPQKLKEVGYRTGMVGKWGLGAPHTESIPTKMGFDFFFGYNCQRQAHTYYPVHLYHNEQRFFLGNDTIAPSTKLAEGDSELDPTSYKNYTLDEYAPDLMFEQLLSFIGDRNDQKDTPFFAYWATPLPHNPIQAPKRWVDYYIKKFGEEDPYLGQRGYFPHQNPRAGYAAMISYLDENVGKLIAYLKENDLYENTLILFSSDNGVTYSGGTDGIYFNSSGIFDEGFGRAKGFVYEGGIRVPLIAHWPGKIKPKSQTDLLSSQYDVMATLSEISGFELSDPTDGISFAPTLLGTAQLKTHNFLYWEYPEYGGQVAIRMGKWKLIRQHLKDDLSPTLELYNLEIDPQELTNVATQFPDIIAKAALIFKEQHTNAEVEDFRIPLIEKSLF